MILVALPATSAPPIGIRRLTATTLPGGGDRIANVERRAPGSRHHGLWARSQV